MDVCVKFPWGVDAFGREKSQAELRGSSYSNGGGTIPHLKHAKKIPGASQLLGFLGWFGEFQFCNRPALDTSFLVVSTAESDTGLSAQGRIDWGGQMGILDPSVQVR